MKRYWITALMLAATAPAAWGYAYQANTGALSYSIFNLSPYTYTFTPYGGGANPNGYYAPSMWTGWGNTDGTVGFFNPTKISPGGTCKNPNAQVWTNVIFYNEDALIPAGSQFSLSNGAAYPYPIVEFSTESTTVANAPAIADSWTLVGNGNTVTLATLASAPNMFISGIESDDYPFCAAFKGLYYNNAINPPQQNGYWSGTWPMVITPAGTFQTVPNPNGPGFTTSSMNFNIDPNATGYMPTGGLWSGVDNPNQAMLAVNSLNLPMYPVNLSAYVAADEVNGDIDQYASPIYGGHLTLAIGDPFLVTSYAAKILWFLVTTTDYAFGPNSLTGDDIGTLQDLVAPHTSNGVFYPTSTSRAYAAWLLGSPAQGDIPGFPGAAGQAASVLETMNQAASKPVTNESIWGKIFSFLTDVATDVTAVAAGALAGPEASMAVEAGVGGTAVGVGDALNSYSTTQITADFTQTESLPAPVAQDAQPVINPSYSSTNLLGMLLTNVFVQAEFNNLLSTEYTENPPSPPPPTVPYNASNFALWSNYSISTDGLCNNISVSNNLFPSDAGCGTQSGTAATYANVLSLNTGSYSTTQLNLWSAILTGADVTANDGYLQLGSTSHAVFQPPTQLVNLTGADSQVSGVDSTFALDSGMIGIASYTVRAVAGQVQSTPSAYPPSLVLAQTGTWAGTEWAWPVPVLLPTYSNTTTTDPGYWYYDATSGAVTITGLQIGSGLNPNGTSWAAYAQPFENGAQTLDTTICEAGSGVVITATPTSTTELEGSLSCVGATYLPGGASGGFPATAPLVNLIQASPIPTGSNGASLGIGFKAPSAGQVSIDIDSGMLTALSYQGWSTNDDASSADDPNWPNKPFINAPVDPDSTTTPAASLGITLNMADCAEGSAVNLYLYPMGGDTAYDAVGYLACADGPPSMPYSLCTNDPQATGGVVVGLKGAPATNGTGATFDLGCACIPSYLGGLSDDPPPSVATFWQTGGTNSEGEPNGVWVGATASNPNGLCN